jgi:hypothetical protein
MHLCAGYDRSNGQATIAPMVRPLLLATFRSSSTVRGGSFKVIGTAASGTAIGPPSWEASFK